MASFSGAMDSPSPVISVVIPWKIFEGRRESTRMVYSDCPSMSMKTGSNNHAARIDGASVWCGAEIADEDNLPVANSDTARIPGRAGAVDDTAVGDDDIEGLRRFLGLGGDEAEEQDHTRE